MDELDIIIKEITPIQKDKYCIIPPEQVIYNSQICQDEGRVLAFSVQERKEWGVLAK